jgi:hypothetical protein
MKMVWRQWVLTQQADSHMIIEELISHEVMENGCLQSSLEAKKRE